jgi:hypothetical protein
LSGEGVPPPRSPPPVAIATTVHCPGRSRGKSRVLANPGTTSDRSRETAANTTPEHGFPLAIAMTPLARGRGQGGGMERRPLWGMGRRPDMVCSFGIAAVVAWSGRGMARRVLRQRLTRLRQPQYSPNPGKIRANGSSGIMPIRYSYMMRRRYVHGDIPGVKSYEFQSLHGGECPTVHR